MAGKKTLPDDVRLAFGSALWRLNQLHRLVLAPKPCGKPITSEAAKAAIREELTAYGLERFPRPGENWPERCEDADP